MNTDVLGRYAAEYGMLLNSSGQNKFMPPLTPFFCDRELVLGLSSLVEKYHRVLEHISSEYERFSEHLGFEDGFHRLISSLPSYRSNIVLGRLDVFPSQSGLSVIEANTESPGGAEECDTIDGLFEGFFPEKVAGSVSHKRLDGYLNAIMDSYVEQAREKGLVPSSNPRMVLLEWPEDVVSHGDRYQIFVDNAKERGIDVSVASPGDVGYDGGFGVVGGEPVDLFYRRFLLHELPEKHPDGFEVIKRLEDSLSTVVNPGRSKSVGNKQVLALISNPAFESLFPVSLVDDVRYLRCVTPPTYSLLHPESLPFSRSDVSLLRDDYVLKAGNGASSTAVWMGSDNSRTSWDGLINRAWGKNYVLQQKVALPRKDIRVFSDGVEDATVFYLLSPYMIGGSFGGVYARATENNLLSSDAGGIATILPVYER